jgi:hypothetical protein
VRPVRPKHVPLHSRHEAELISDVRQFEGD